VLVRGLVLSGIRFSVVTGENGRSVLKAEGESQLLEQLETTLRKRRAVGQAWLLPDLSS